MSSTCLLASAPVSGHLAATASVDHGDASPVAAASPACMLPHHQDAEATEADVERGLRCSEELLQLCQQFMLRR